MDGIFAKSQAACCGACLKKGRFTCVIGNIRRSEAHAARGIPVQQESPGSVGMRFQVKLPKGQQGFRQEGGTGGAGSGTHPKTGSWITGLRPQGRRSVSFASSRR